MIRATVIDADDRLPIPGVVVRLMGSNGQPTGTGGVTDDDGVVSLQDPGVYRFQLVGYDPFTGTVDSDATYAMKFASNELADATVYGKRPTRWPVLVLVAAIILDQ